MAKAIRDLLKALNYKTPAARFDALLKLDDSDMDRVITHLQKRATTNLTRLEKANLTHSPAYRGLSEQVRKGYVTPLAGTTTKQKVKEVKDKSKFEKATEAIELDKFLKAKTHTTTEAKKWERVIDSRLGHTYANASDSAKKSFWRLYENFRHTIGLYKGLDSEEVHKMLWDYWDSINAKYVTQKRVDEFEMIVDGLIEKLGGFD